ncbi:MAG: helix-hairpin-helix domain-containing protein [Microthrixaceae bacterium]
MLFGLSIVHLGPTGAQLLVDHLRTLGAIMAADAEEIAGIDGIGPVIAIGTHDFFAVRPTGSWWRDWSGGGHHRGSRTR